MLEHDWDLCHTNQKNVAFITRSLPLITRAGIILNLRICDIFLFYFERKSAFISTRKKYAFIYILMSNVIGTILMFCLYAHVKIKKTSTNESGES